MKKINYNIITFVITVLFIIGGWFSKQLFWDIKDAALNFFNTFSVTTFISDIESASKNISYKNKLIDLYSIYYRITDTTIVEKSDTTIVRMQNNYLGVEDEKLSDDSVSEMADHILDLQQITDDLEIPFVYVMAPKKLYFEDQSSVRYNYNLFSKKLKDLNIDVLDLAQKMSEQNILMEDYYFVTDHHWTPEAGFWAVNELSQKLTNDYQLSLEEDIFRLENYTVSVYENMFLGSTGKKVGKYFTPFGLDDISLITPNFDTQLTVNDKRGQREGTYLETLINMEELTSADYYSANPYAAYSYGNSGLQLIENQLAKSDSPEIIIIRDSFACTVTPFLSLSTKALHVIDIRYWESSGATDTISEYIKMVNPDCVVVFYSLIQPDMLEF